MRVSRSGEKRGLPVLKAGDVFSWDDDLYMVLDPSSHISKTENRVYAARLLTGAVCWFRADGGAAIKLVVGSFTEGV